MSRLTAKLMNRVTAKIVVVKLVKLHLTKLIIIIIIIIIQAYIALFLGIQQCFTIYAIKILKTIIETN